MISRKSLDNIREIYPITVSVLCDEALGRIASDIKDEKPGDMHAYLKKNPKDDIPPFIPDLALLEWKKYNVSRQNAAGDRVPGKYDLNPSLEVVKVGWKLVPFFYDKAGRGSAGVEMSGDLVLMWKDRSTGEVIVKSATDKEILAIKFIVDELDFEDIAAGWITRMRFRKILSEMTRKGILLTGGSSLRRSGSAFAMEDIPEERMAADTFTLQWHITNACDLKCRHCYDRSKRSPLTLKDGMKILGDMERFCFERNTRGHICFTGGNPFMSPVFFELYRSAAQRGFSTSILGNPVKRPLLEKMIEIQKPGYFQVSLEGLWRHNDFIRGEGHYSRVMGFLDILKELHIKATVMLTLTKDNMDQVIPLSRELKGKADYFTFNRLSQVGEGADLALPSRSEYAVFLDKYVEASRDNPIIGFKDNLLNIILDKRGEKAFSGCTGYGCGAAFNFITVLPDGEAHACRKFPSLIGNALNQTIQDIYDSDIAQKYREGCRRCDGCRLRPVCGGCLAVANGQGLDVFNDVDPFCFIDDDTSPGRR